jgi:hypothetical protein
LSPVDQAAPLGDCLIPVFALLGVENFSTSFGEMFIRNTDVSHTISDVDILSVEASMTAKFFLRAFEPGQQNGIAIQTLSAGRGCGRAAGLRIKDGV